MTFVLSLLLVIARSSNALAHDEIHTRLLMMHFSLIYLSSFCVSSSTWPGQCARILTENTLHDGVCIENTWLTVFNSYLSLLNVLSYASCEPCCWYESFWKLGEKKSHGEGKKGGIEHELCIHEVADWGITSSWQSNISCRIKVWIFENM